MKPVLEARLRFPDFKGTEYTLYSTSDFLTRHSTPVILKEDTHYTEIGIRSWGKGIFHKQPVTSKDIGNKRVFWLEKNLFVVNIVFAWEQAVAATSVNEVGKIASHRFPMFEVAKDKADLSYIVYKFLTNRGKQLLELASPGGAGRNKTLGQKEFDNLKLYLPTPKEQQRIADFITSVDTKISQLTEKHRLLKEYKKGVMQQIFSQQSRFKDNDGKAFPDWKTEAIGKYLEPYKELVPASTDLPILTSSRTGLYLQERSVINDGDYGVVPLGYFTYRHMSDDLIFKFNVNRNYTRGAISKEYPVFKTVGMDTYFLETKLNEGHEFKRFAIQQKQGGTRTRLYFKNLKELKLALPCLAEQQKIAQFLQSIDNKIDSVADQIEQTKQFKKGLLQQMFV
ncbi:restriction endonuclease subunit S [Vibrio coralliilyticus OCN008]|uniref:restriction endonuclease subunit S n=1 Tax=Vibrio coralliilyticus TaxID=190893 RepID=UPI000390B353|nr:restriction endonuclease subunit S [Vibrio coralliilyticus]ERB64030.1 hypothetical protein N779_17760 [Vibrio coralliilyticus OCN008]QIJ83331.1 restriction endonuclease subunit S [Vibrio coralliilyticus OCN008]